MSKKETIHKLLVVLTVILSDVIMIIKSELCIAELNPLEIKRIYSSVYANEQSGIGHSRSMLDSDQAWSAAINDVYQWMIIDLENLYTIGALVIQARNYYNLGQYVSKVELSTSTDGVNYIIQNGKHLANAQSDSFRYYFKLDKSVIAKYVKIHPLEWYGHISMRAGILAYFNSVIDCNRNNLYYLDINYSYTKKCDDSCTNCEFYVNKCITCALNYFPIETDRTRCYRAAPSGFYLDNVEKLYKKCSKPCKDCVDDSDKCTSCVDDYYSKVNENVCYNIQAKPEGFYIPKRMNPGETIYLLPCDITCKTCEISSKSCLTCASGLFQRYQEESFCYNAYLSGFYLYLNKLKKCDDSCKECTDFNKCSVCSLDYNWKQNEKIYCYKKNIPIERYYLSTQPGSDNIFYFLECEISCKKCTNASKCTECKENYYWEKNERTLCYHKDLMNGFYLSTFTDSGNIPFFSKCDESCKKCIDFKTCTECNNEYYWKQGEKTYCYHKDLIPLGFYLPLKIDEGETPYLLNCDLSCKKCKDYSYECTECNKDYYWKQGKRTYCYHKDLIPIGFYLPFKIDEGEITYLLNCDKSCSKCKEYSYKCTECNKENYWKEKEKLNCYHKDKIEDGFYLDVVDNLIKECDTKICSTCIDNSKNCIKCRDNYYKILNVEKLNIEKLKVTKNLCYEEKFEGFFLDTSKTLLNRCDISCKTCEKNSKNCILCSEDWFKKEEDLDNNNECFNKNDEVKGFFLDGKLFKKCDESCSTCFENKYKCKECNEKYNKFTNKEFKYDLNSLKYPPHIELINKLDFICLKDVIIGGFIIDENDKLYKKCHEGCESCDTDGCILCDNKENFYFYEDDLKKCSMGDKPYYYLDEKKKTFFKCSLGCQKCTSKKSCIGCENEKGYYGLKLNNTSLHLIDNSTCNKGCPKNYVIHSSGKYCEFLNLNLNLDELSAKVEKLALNTLERMKENISVSDIDNLKNIFTAVPDAPVSDEVANSLVDLSKNTMEKVMKGEIEPDPKLLNLTSVALTAKIRNMNQKNTETNNKSQGNSTEEDKQKTLDAIKLGVNGFLDSLINKSENNKSQIMNTDVFSVEISSIKNQNLEEAVKNNMTVGNFSNCENILKKYHNISEEVSLQIKKIEYDPSTDIKRADDINASKGVSFQFINPLNNNKLDSNLCNEVTTPLKIPFKKSERINIGLYQSTQALRDIVDLYNKNSPGYSTRCLKTTNDDSADTSVNYRRTKMFQNTSMECSPGCEYKGLDDNKYVICDCQVSGKNEVSNTGEETSLVKFPALNFNIVLCYKEAYSDAKLIENLGFIYTIIFMIFACSSYFLFRNIGKNLIKSKLIDLQRNDCLGYNSEKFSIKRYFLRKYFTKSSQQENYLKLNSLINDQLSKGISFSNDELIISPIEKSINPFDYRRKKNRKISTLDYKRIIVIDENYYEGYLFSIKTTNLGDMEKIKQESSEGKYFMKSKSPFIKNTKLPDEIRFENYNKLLLQNKLGIKKDPKTKNKLKKFKNEQNSKLIFKLKFITLKDYGELNPYEAIIYDKRTFLELLFDKLKEEHIFFNLIFHNSLLEPLWIRFNLFYFNLSLLFALSALFFTDDYIDMRVDVPKEERDSPLYSLMNETFKTLLSILFSFVILYLLDMSQAVDEHHEEKISKALKKGDKINLMKKYAKFEKIMIRKYSTFLILSIILNLVCLYYSTIFCYIYSNSVNGWVQGGIFGFLLDVCAISIAIPLIKVTVRIVIRRFKFLRFLIIIDYSFFILNFIL